MNAAGTGYFQQGFFVTCPKKDCIPTRITKGTLALRKIAHDFAAGSGSTTLEPSAHLA